MGWFYVLRRYEPSGTTMKQTLLAEHTPIMIVVYPSGPVDVGPSVEFSAFVLNDRSVAEPCQFQFAVLRSPLSWFSVV